MAPKKRVKSRGNTRSARISAKVSKLMGEKKSRTRSQAVAIAHDMEERGELS